MSLFKNEQPKKAVRAYRVECLNKDKGISTSMRVSKDQKDYTVCLFMVGKTTKTVFHNESSALEQMRKYRALYKSLGPEK